MSDKENAAAPKVDEDLSELLDSALQDFAKEPSKKDERDESHESSTATTTTTSSDVSLPQEWSNDFIQQAASQFEENFASLLAGVDPDAQISPDLIQQKLRQMADAAQQVVENPTQTSAGSNDIAASISQAIQGLSAGAEGLQAPLNEEDLMKMFGGAGGLGQENDLLPFMQGMMQGLLSKEVLGPSLEDFTQKLPEYIEKNKEKLSKSDIERYDNQRKLMEEVLGELNKEKDTDSSSVKSERFTKVLGLMQKLQDYGQPPIELVGNLDGPFNFDAQGNPTNFPGGPNQECSIM